MNLQQITEAVRLSDQLYAARDTARVMCGERYPEIMARFGGHIERLAPYCGGRLAAAEKWARSAADADDEKSAVVILAAAVELIDPSVAPNG